MNDMPDNEWFQLTIGGSCLPMSGAYISMDFSDPANTSIKLSLEDELSDSELLVMSAVLSEVISQIAATMLRRGSVELQ